MERVGIVAFQGDFARHAAVVSSLGALPIEVRTRGDLRLVDRLIIPGGESTTIGMLMEREELITAVRSRMESGMPVFGTCAGMILLADEILESEQPRIGGLAITIRRNAYGRQIESFETVLRAPAISPRPLEAVFIRAPVVEAVNGRAQTLAEYEGHAVIVRQGSVLGAAFHPELTDDPAVHRYFLAL